MSRARPRIVGLWWGQGVGCEVQSHPRKARFWDAMYQSSLQYARKWGVTQRKAFSALHVFYRDLSCLSEDLCDPSRDVFIVKT